MTKINLARRICAMLLALALIAGAACAESKGLMNWLGGLRNPKPGDKVYIEASDRTDEGLTFVYWRSELKDLKIDDIYSPNTYYIMPEGNPEIKIQAVYTKLKNAPTATPVPTSTPITKPVIIITPTPVPTSAPTSAPAIEQHSDDLYYVSFCEESVSLRKSPSTDASKLMNVPLGACVKAISYDHGDFLHVSYDGREGYILWEYLLGYDNMPALPGETMHIVNCESYVTLRKTPFTFGTELTTIPLGAEVEFLALAANDYAHIRYGNLEGFVMAYFVGN